MEVKFKTARGGSRVNAGRPSIENKTKSRSIRLTDDDYVKFKLIGGVKWLREILNTKYSK